MPLSPEQAGPRNLGPFKLQLVNDCDFRLDGGAMFGVVPKPLWERKKPSDARNRITMSTRCLLVERGDELLLVDTGIGDKNDAKFRDIYGMAEGAPRLPDAVREAGYELGDVTHVVMTHLHFDHCGWNTREQGGRYVPTFPKARYWMSRGEMAHADAPNARDRASYLPVNWQPLVDAGVVELFDGEAEPLAGVTAVEVPGHNANMCIVRLDGGAPDAQAVYWADLIPTVAHVPFPWVMGYDLYPLQTLANKELWIPRAADGDWLSIFEHESDMPWARIGRDERGRFTARPAPV